MTQKTNKGGQQRTSETGGAAKSAEDTAQLLAAIERFPGTGILVVGDLIVDDYVWGRVDRISPEAPVVVVRVTEENQRLGGAGNVVNNLVALGAKVSVSGVVGQDAAADQVREMFREAGVDISGVVTDASRRTTIKTRVIAHAQQVVRVDREDAKQVDDTIAAKLSQAIGERIARVQGVIVSDYGKGAICPRVFSELSAKQRAGEIGFGKRPLLVDPKAPNFALYSGATVIKPNRSEAQHASGIEISDRKQAIAAGKILLDKWNADILLITLGEDGMVLVSRRDDTEHAIEIDTVAREVYDVSGAGDTVSAVFMLALASGSSPRIAAELANFAAGIVVAEIGTVSVSTDELRDAVTHGGE